MGRFMIGLLIGTGIGFAGVLLFAGRRREGEEAPEGPPTGPGEEQEGMIAGVKRTVQGLQERVEEALAEAKEASREAEREIRDAYERERSSPPEQE